MKNKIAAQIESPGRRAAAYWFVDGLPEIVVGSALLIFGISFIVGRELARTNRWIFPGILLVIALCFTVIINHRRILEYFKARITYPRTGYARPPANYPSKNDWPDKILTLGLAHKVDENVSTFLNFTIYMFILPTWLMGFLPISWILSFWILPLVMTVVAACVYLWNRDDVRPYSPGAVLPIAAAGFIAAGFDLTEEACVYAPVVIGGAWLLGIGSWTLSRYLQEHPKMDSGEAGRS